MRHRPRPSLPRLRSARALLAAAVMIMTAGCALVPTPPNSPDRPSPASPTAVPPTTGQPTAEQTGADFDDIVATERLPDGLAAQELRIMRDGAALNLESINRIGGRVPAATLEELRPLLESPELIEEAAVLETFVNGVCDDSLGIHELTMGDLHIVEKLPCTIPVDTPVLDQIKQLLDEVRKDGITKPLGADGPHFSSIDLEEIFDGRSSGSKITVRPDRTVVRHGPYETSGTIDQPQFDAIRMITAGELCTEPAGEFEHGHLISVDGREPVAVQFLDPKGRCVAGNALVSIVADAV
ncbi:hypothetical protein [Microlunatus parietis]|uniref:Secreted protein n=1 Tax=Microlunatus parietis TaxID=682979 RepID=A0A7Y9L916_9ACTN|nr:hypothetical protein [Microlunatus parietis]NYE69092.1 hypothetical protein [Microlunatus parietis]